MVKMWNQTYIHQYVTSKYICILRAMSEHRQLTIRLYFFPFCMLFWMSDFKHSSSCVTCFESGDWGIFLPWLCINNKMKQLEKCTSGLMHSSYPKKKKKSEQEIWLMFFKKIHPQFLSVLFMSLEEWKEKRFVFTCKASLSCPIPQKSWTVRTSQVRASH